MKPESESVAASAPPSSSSPTTQPKKDHLHVPASPSHADPSRIASPPVIAGSTDLAVLLYLTEGSDLFLRTRFFFSMRFSHPWLGL